MNNMSVGVFLYSGCNYDLLRIKKKCINNSNNSQQDEKRVVSIFIYTVTHINK